MYAQAPINATYHPAIVIGPGNATIAIEVRSDFHHAAHAVHGAVYFKLLDDAAFFAVQSESEQYFVLTSAFSLHFLKPVSSGQLTAVGRVTHRARRLVLADAELRDDAGDLVARGTGTFVRSGIRLSEELGYRVGS